MITARLVSRLRLVDRSSYADRALLRRVYRAWKGKDRGPNARSRWLDAIEAAVAGAVLRQDFSRWLRAIAEILVFLLGARAFAPSPVLVPAHGVRHG